MLFSRMKSKLGTDTVFANAEPKPNGCIWNTCGKYRLSLKNQKKNRKKCVKKFSNR